MPDEQGKGIPHGFVRHPSGALIPSQERAGEVSWRLRYAPEALTREDQLTAASIVSLWIHDVPSAVPVPSGAHQEELRTALQELADAVTAEVNEKGGGGYLLARLADARAVLKRSAPPLSQTDRAATPHHMKKGDSTVCGAARERGNSYYEWAYVDCHECLKTRPSSPQVGRAEIERLRDYAVHKEDCEMTDPRQGFGYVRAWVNEPVRREAVCTCGLSALLTGHEQQP